MKTKEPRKLSEALESLGVTATSERGAPENPEFQGFAGYMVSLSFGKRRLKVPFYVGPGWGVIRPTAADVLSCLISDAVSMGASFEEWCYDLGYDSDSRRAEKIYRQCARLAQKVRAFLGGHFDALAACEH